MLPTHLQTLWHAVMSIGCVLFFLLRVQAYPSLWEVRSSFALAVILTFCIWPHGVEWNTLAEAIMGNSGIYDMCCCLGILIWWWPVQSEVMKSVSQETRRMNSDPKLGKDFHF